MVAPPADARVRLRISAASGRVTAIAESREDVFVERGGSLQAAADGAVEVRPTRRSDSVVVRCPLGADVVVGTQSGSIDLVGQFGAVGVTSHSGSMHVASVASADLRTVSGRVDVDECAGRCRISTTSGRITVGSAGDAEVSTTSGRVRVGGVHGSAQLRSVSGAVDLVSSGGGPIRISTVSGTIDLRLPSGMRPHVRSAGRARVKGTFEPGDDVQIDVAAISGTVRLVTS